VDGEDLHRVCVGLRVPGVEPALLVASGPATAFAASRISESLRQLVESGSTSAGPASLANSAGKRSRVVALAPRQP